MRIGRFSPASSIFPAFPTSYSFPSNPSRRPRAKAVPYEHLPEKTRRQPRQRRQVHRTPHRRRQIALRPERPQARTRHRRTHRRRPSKPDSSPPRETKPPRTRSIPRTPTFASPPVSIASAESPIPSGSSSAIGCHSSAATAAPSRSSTASSPSATPRRTNPPPWRTAANSQPPTAKSCLPVTFSQFRSITTDADHSPGPPIFFSHSS